MSIEMTREIRSWQAARVLPDLLQTLFVAEFIMPSDELWLVSPWISDIPIIDNSAGEFTPLVPEWDCTIIRLSQVLHQLVCRGAEVNIATKIGEHSQTFFNLLRGLPATTTGRLQLWQAPLLHEKGLLGKDFFLSGSFNFTFFGVTMNEEFAHLSINPIVISENRIAFRERWK